jgi:hypothetical protein
MFIVHGERERGRADARAIRRAIKMGVQLIMFNSRALFTGHNHPFLTPYEL